MSSAYQPSNWRVSIIPTNMKPTTAATSSSSASSTSPSQQLHLGRCYHQAEINQYYQPEISEIFDLGAVPCTFYLKFERVHDTNPTYIGIYFDEILMDHFYIAPEEKWATSMGWQKDQNEIFPYIFTPLDSSYLTSDKSWVTNPQLLGHLMIRFYHISKPDVNTFTNTFLKKPLKRRFNNPKLNIYALYGNKPLHSLIQKKRLQSIPFDVPFLYVILRYDDIARKSYGSKLTLQDTPQSKNQLSSSSFKPNLTLLDNENQETNSPPSSSSATILKHQQYLQEINKILEETKKSILDIEL